MKEFHTHNIGNGLYKVKIDGVELEELYPYSELGDLYARYWKGSDSHEQGDSPTE